MLAACQDGAAQFLAWPSGGIGVAGAIAVKGVYCMTADCWTNAWLQQAICAASMPCQHQLRRGLAAPG
jgi:hypothetical protein